MDQAWVELNTKLDALAEQVAYLSDQGRMAERQRQDRAELMHDLTLIADRASRLTTGQTEEAQEFGDPGDLLREMRDPSGRRGLALTMRVLQAIGAQAGAGERGA